MIALDRPTALAALEAAKGNLRDAAKALGMSYRTLYRRIDDLNLRRDLARIRPKIPFCPMCKRPL